MEHNNANMDKYNSETLWRIYQDHQQLISAADSKAVFYFGAHTLVAGVYVTLISYFGFPKPMTNFMKNDGIIKEAAVVFFWSSFISTILAFLVGLGTLLYYVVFPRYYWLRKAPKSLIFAKSIRNDFKSPDDYFRALNEATNVQEDFAKEIFRLAETINRKMKGLAISACTLLVYFISAVFQAITILVIT